MFVKNQSINEGGDMLNVIDCDSKAYLLGWIASNGHFTGSVMTILVDERDSICLELLRDIMSHEVKVEENHDTSSVYLEVSSEQMRKNVCRHLMIKPTENIKDARFPSLKNDVLHWAFIRGYFDGHGHLEERSQNACPQCIIACNSILMLEDMSAFVNIPHSVQQNIIMEFHDTNCIDFLGKLYSGCGSLKLQRHHDAFVSWLKWAPCANKSLPECYVYKTTCDAVIPSKTKISDAGYDLTVIKEEKKFLNNVTLYDTGIKIKVKHGMYAEVVPRSSLSKSGYMLANSIGIIDQGYNGNIYIALVKVDPSAPDMTLPFKCCQLIFRNQVHVDMVQVLEDFKDTSRGSGGFGSTNVCTN